jgi:hydrogenase nickel incorporation protein HypB
MCGTCGCSDEVKATITDPVTGEHSHLYHEHPAGSGDAHDHHPSHELRHLHHDHGHGHADDHVHTHLDDPVHARGQGPTAERVEVKEGRSDRATTTMAIRAALLGKNDARAARNRAWLAGRQVLALNLVSSPGSGKTSLLERTIRELGAERWIGVVEGDQQTTLDAERIHATGAPSIQVNTGTGCHLEADMVWEAIKVLQPPPGGLLLVENVGNLVCPALFDLGEASKVAILSVTEGEDKPLKYPHMFRASRLLLLNKIDLLPYLDFDLERCVRFAREVNPDLEVLAVSVKTGTGLDRWYGWLRSRAAELDQRAFDS